MVARNDEWAQIQPAVRRLRERDGLDSAGLRLDTSRASVDRWARGVCIPHPKTRARVAVCLEALGLLQEVRQDAP